MVSLDVDQFRSEELVYIALNRLRPTLRKNLAIYD